MNTSPLHPAMVHIPIGLAVALPLIALAVHLSVWKGWVNRQVWILIVIFQGIIFGSSLLAFKTGDMEVNTIEAITGHDAIHEHERRAEMFIWSSGITFAAGTLSVFVPTASLATSIRIISLLGSGTTGVLAYPVGYTGGDLVYKYHAADAYMSDKKK